MRFNIISSIANVRPRFSVNADMLRSGNDPAAMSWRLALCTADPDSAGRHPGATTQLGNVIAGKGKSNYLRFTQPATRQTQEQASGPLFQGIG